jgi:hypothetical protein
VLFGLAFRWRAFAAYLILTAVSGLVALYGAEITLRVAVAPRVPVEFETSYADKAIELIWAAEEKGRRLRPLRSYKATTSTDADGRYHSRIRIKNREVMKLGGPSKSSVLVRDPVAQDWVEVTTDRYGHLNDDSIWQQAPIDALVVGASNTKGSGARPGRDFVSLFKGESRSVAKLALGGIGPLSKLGMVREFGPLLKPHTVFWVYADRNDLEEDLKDEMRTPILAKYLNAGYSQNLAALETELDSAADALVMAYLARQGKQRKNANRAKAEPKFDWPDFVKLARLRGRLGIVAGTPVTAAQLSTWAEAIAMAKRDIAAWGGRMVVVYLPMPRTLRTHSDDPFKPYVLNALRKLNVPLVDFSAELLQLADPMSVYRLADGSLSNHYNEDGHRRLAQSLARFLKRRTAHEATTPAQK